MNYDAVAAGTLSEFKKQWSGTERPLIGITVEDAYTKCKELAKIPVKEEKK